jgi:hypothetical protein
MHGFKLWERGGGRDAERNITRYKIMKEGEMNIKKSRKTIWETRGIRNLKRIIGKQFGKLDGRGNRKGEREQQSIEKRSTFEEGKRTYM